MKAQDDAIRLFAPGGLIRLALRVAVAGTLLVLVFRMALPKTEAGIARAILSAWQTGPTEASCWFALAFSLFGVSFAIGASRFAILLAGAGFEVAWWILFRAYLVAGFFNLVLPGAILGDVDQTPGQVTGIGGLERGIRQSLAGAMGRVEVLEHGQPFLEVGDDRRFDDFARWLGHEAAHTGQLLQLRRLGRKRVA